MEKDLQQILRSVLKEELNPINGRLSTIEKDMEQLKIDTSEIKLTQEKYHKEMIKALGENTDKIIQEYIYHTLALNKRVFSNESELERLRKQLMELMNK